MVLAFNQPYGEISDAFNKMLELEKYSFIEIDAVENLQYEKQEKETDNIIYGE